MDNYIHHRVTVTRIRHCPIAIVPFFEITYRYEPGSLYADANLLRRPTHTCTAVILQGVGQEALDWVDLFKLIPKRLNERHSIPFNSPECPLFTPNSVSYNLEDTVYA